jgi:hypothetical protein
MEVSTGFTERRNLIRAESVALEEFFELAKRSTLPPQSPRLRWAWPEPLWAAISLPRL